MAPGRCAGAVLRRRCGRCARAAARAAEVALPPDRNPDRTLSPCHAPHRRGPGLPRSAAAGRPRFDGRARCRQASTGRRAVRSAPRRFHAADTPEARAALRARLDAASARIPRQGPWPAEYRSTLLRPLLRFHRRRQGGEPPESTARTGPHHPRRKTTVAVERHRALLAILLNHPVPDQRRGGGAVPGCAMPAPYAHRCVQRRPAYTGMIRPDVLDSDGPHEPTSHSVRIMPRDGFEMLLSNAAHATCRPVPAQRCDAGGGGGGMVALSSDLLNRPRLGGGGCRCSLPHSSRAPGPLRRQDRLVALCGRPGPPLRATPRWMTPRISIEVEPDPALVPVSWSFTPRWRRSPPRTAESATAEQDADTTLLDTNARRRQAPDRAGARSGATSRSTS